MLGVPSSWAKVHMGQQIKWIGWDLCLQSEAALLPSDKREKLLALLEPIRKGHKLKKSCLQTLVGMLVWFTGGQQWLRPFLSALFSLLHKPRAAALYLDRAQSSEIVACLNSALFVQSKPQQSDVQTGWKLHSVSNHIIHASSDAVLSHPPIRRNRIWHVFYDYSSSWWCKVDEDSAMATGLFRRAILLQQPIPLKIQRCCLGSTRSAADAFAERSHGGIGGWFIPPGQDMTARDAI